MNQLAGINDQKITAGIITEETVAWANRYREHPEECFPLPIVTNNYGKMENKNGLFSIFGNKDVYLTQPNTLRSMDGKTKVTWKNTPEGTKFWTIKGGSRIISSLFNGKNRLACTCDKGKKPMPVETRYFYSENDKPPLPTELPDKQVVNILLICKKGVIEEINLSETTPLQCQKKTKKPHPKKEKHCNKRKRNFQSQW